MSDDAVSPLYRRVARRDPFAVESLPLIARFYRAGYRRRRRFAKRFVGRPAGALFRFAYKVLKLNGQGRFALRLADAEKHLAFDARNIQYCALYMPEFMAGGYEPETAALLDALVGDRDVFHDVGANWGYFALFLAARPGFAGAVHAFEPFPDSFRDLEDMVSQAGLEQTVHCHRIALSDAAGRQPMGVEDGVMSGIARLGATVAGPDVDLAALDDLDLPPPAVIKVDVEGHEAEMLAGAGRILAEHKPLVVFESWRESGRPLVTLEPFRVLGDLGYVFFQPAWAARAGAGAYAVADLTAAGGRGREAVLALIPLWPEQRFLLADQMSVLACHRDRLDNLRRLFSPQPPDG